MPIFQANNKKLTQIKEVNIDLEKDLQKLTEENLETVFGLKFITSEFSLKNFRIDTLAFDLETKSFVIIEYKKDRSFSIVDQGFTYLSLMINNKADFILELGGKLKNKISREDIDWSQSKVLFLANSFTVYQQNAISFQGLAFELWEVKKYDNNTILYNQIKASETNESIDTVTKNKKYKDVSREVKKYTVDDHFKPDWTTSRELFQELREKILNIDSRIEEKPVKYYIGYKINTSVLVGIGVQKEKLVFELWRVRPKDLRDPEGKLIYRKRSFEFYNKHISDYYIKSKDDIDYGIFLAKQVYEKFFKNN